jgi:hypothetical protein
MTQQPGAQPIVRFQTMRTSVGAIVVLPYDQRVATRWGEI